MFRWNFTRVMMPEGEGGGSGGGEGAGDSGGEGGEGGKGDGGEGGGTILDAGGEGGGEGGGDGDGKWSWGENVPGTGTAPPWLKSDKFKTVADQARGFTELETKIGPAAELIGAPEGDYEMPKLPDGVEGEWDVDDAMFKTFSATAKEVGLSQAAFDKLATPIAKLLAEENAADEKAVSDSLAEIGTNVKERITQVKTYLTAELGEDGYNSLNDAVGTDVKAYLAMEKLVAMASGDARLADLPGMQGPGFTKADIETERYKVYPEGHRMAGQSVYEHDKEHRAKVKGMYKELFPGEDKQEVGG